MRVNAGGVLVYVGRMIMGGSVDVGESVGNGGGDSVEVGVIPADGSVGVGESAGNVGRSLVEVGRIRAGGSVGAGDSVVTGTSVNSAIPKVGYASPIMDSSPSARVISSFVDISNKCSITPGGAFFPVQYAL
jgi:hypothetical protein